MKLSNKENVITPFTSPELYDYIFFDRSFTMENIEKSLIFNIGVILS